MKPFTKLLLLLLLSTLAFGAHSQDMKIGDPEVSYAKGEELRKKGDINGAISYFQKAVQFDPNNHKYYYSISKAYSQLNDLPNTIMYAQKSVEISPSFVPALSMLGRCYDSLNKHDLMIDAYSKAFKYDYDNANKLNYKTKIVQALVKAEKYSVAEPHVKDGLAIAPQDVKMLFFDAQVSNRLGNYNQAIKSLSSAFTQITGNEPKANAKYYYELGYAYNKLGEYEKSNQAFEKAKYGPYAALVDEMSPKFYCNLAQCYLKVYKMEESKAAVQAAIKMQHSFSQGHLLMAKILDAETKMTHVIAEYKLAAEGESVEKKKAEILKTILELELQHGLYKDAIGTANKYLAINNYDYGVIFMKSIALAKDHKTNEAISTLENLCGTSSMIDTETRAQYQFALALMLKEANRMEDAKTFLKKSAIGSFKGVAEKEYNAIIEAEKKTVVKKTN